MNIKDMLRGASQSGVRQPNSNAPLTLRGPAKCFRLGHSWTEWGPFVLVNVPIPARVRRSDEVPSPQPIQAYRRRGCRECRMVEEQDYRDNSVTVIENPHGMPVSGKTQGEER